MKRVILVLAALTYCVLAKGDDVVIVEMVDDINPLGDSAPTWITNVDGTVYFRATDGPAGAELWKSDGTESGTQRVRDIRLGPSGSAPEEFASLDGEVFFSAADENGDRELWKSDGTETGTGRVANIHPGGSSSPRELTVLGGIVLFGAEAPASEGNPPGTERAMWKSDGTVTELVWDATSFKDDNVERLRRVGSEVFFKLTNSGGAELFKTDGTEAGTRRVKNINTKGGGLGPDSSNPDHLTDFNGTLFFSADDGNTGRELWRSDGIPETDGGIGTFQVKDINVPDTGEGTEFEGLTVVGSNLFFGADDGTTGRELWKSDGTPGNAMPVKDISDTGGDGDPTELTAFDGLLFFSAFGGLDGRELWKSDGTLGGTSMVKDINPFNFAGGEPTHLTAVNGRLFFAATAVSDARELWVSDGTGAGTVQAEDINPSGSSNPVELTDVNGILYFQADDGKNGKELWRAYVDDTANLDDDGDGLPDAFELTNGLNPVWDGDRDLDKDRDGISNYDEFLLGTDLSIPDPDSDLDGVADPIDSDPADALNSGRVVFLPHGEFDPGAYGFGFGSDAHHSKLGAVFSGSGNPYLLHLRGHDVDSGKELKVSLNGNRLGRLKKGKDGKPALDSLFWLQASQVQAGLNRIDIEQTDPGTSWGVDRLGIFEEGVALGNIKGNPNETDTRHKKGFDLHVPNGSHHLLEVQAWDNDEDRKGEVQLQLNGKVLGRIPKGRNNKWTPRHPLYLPEKKLKNGDNVIRISNAVKKKNWGLRLIAYTDGKRQFGKLPEVDAAFKKIVRFLVPVDKNKPRRIYFDYNDVDSRKELKIAVDGRAAGTAPTSKNNKWVKAGAIVLPDTAKARLSQVDVKTTKGNRWGVRVRKSN